MLKIIIMIVTYLYFLTRWKQIAQDLRDPIACSLHVRPRPPHPSYTIYARYPGPSLGTRLNLRMRAKLNAALIIGSVSTHAHYTRPVSRCLVLYREGISSSILLVYTIYQPEWHWNRTKSWWEWFYIIDCIKLCNFKFTKFTHLSIFHKQQEYSGYMYYYTCRYSRKFFTGQNFTQSCISLTENLIQWNKISAHVCTKDLLCIITKNAR